MPLNSVHYSKGDIHEGTCMGRGGTRKGAGRPPKAEKTKPIRIPEKMVSAVQSFVNSRGYKYPLYSSSVPAGFPSPAEDHIEGKLDLNDLLIKHPAATFFVRASGDSMINTGIHSGDILVVDRSIEPVHGKIVIAAVDGQLTVKRLYKSKDRIALMPENNAFSAIEITSENDVHIWGVVTNVVHPL